MSEVELVELATCASTQDQARALLAERDDGALLAVSAHSQTAGRGRGGRSWQDPAHSALLLSVARRGPLSATVLQDLPRRVVEALLDAIGEQVTDVRTHVAWKAPNDLVDARSGAKLAGVLVDARSSGARVTEVIVGVGVNLDAAPFTTRDGRAAGSIAASCGQAPQHAALVSAAVRRIAALLD